MLCNIWREDLSFLLESVTSALLVIVESDGRVSFHYIAPDALWERAGAFRFWAKERVGARMVWRLVKRAAYSVGGCWVWFPAGVTYAPALCLLAAFRAVAACLKNFGGVG